MGNQHSYTVAVVQQPPVWLDRAATLQRAGDLIAEAAANGARLVAFPEAFVPGYPVWIWSLQPDNAGINAELYGRLVDQSVDLASDDLRPLLDAARAHGVTVVCGLNERDRAFSGTTLYTTVVIIGPDGRLLNRHRKLVPTNAERMVWTQGDAAGLRTVDSTSGKLGSLICWENYMPLARFTLYAQGVEIYLAPTWDNGDRWVGSMRHIASEGRCWVLGCGNAMTVDNIPADIPGRDLFLAHIEEWINDGDSVVISPKGEIRAGPMRRETGILYADCDPHEVAQARYQLDVAGHYGRPDVFQLQVRRSVGRPLTITADEPPVADNVNQNASAGHGPPNLGDLSPLDDRPVFE